MSASRNLNLNLSLKQSLFVNAELKLAIGLLSLTTEELHDQIKKEVEDNPVLEIISNSIRAKSSSPYSGSDNGLENRLNDLAEDANIFDQALTPHIDAYIFRAHHNKNKFEIELNDSGLPKLQISAYYLKAQRDPTSQKFIKEKIKKAKFFIKAIYERQNNFKKVLRALIDRQISWFQHPESRLSAMKLEDIANTAEVHASTVSRICKNKNISTPNGIFELKYFFSSQVGEYSSFEIKKEIAKLIKQEDKNKTLSDQQIKNKLEELDMVIARRTIGKYRSMLGLKSAAARKHAACN